MKVYILTVTSQLGQGDQPSSSVLGVYQSKVRAEQAHREAVVDEMADYINLYDEASTQDARYSTLITNPSDDSYWTLIQLHEREIE